MKIALLGDIHGNDQALSAVLEAASRANVDRLLVTGDLVGYYFNPLQVLKLLSSWDHHVVGGNHEAMLSGARLDNFKLSDIERRYGSGLRIAIQQMSSDQLDGLCNLPHRLEIEIDGVKALLCHGAPWNVDEYIYPDVDAETLARCAAENYDLIVMGHTHYPMFKMVGNTILINPGSVGQPRDRKPGACWAFFDTESRAVEFRRENYDSSDLIQECQTRHPELPYLSEVLLRI